MIFEDLFLKTEIFSADNIGYAPNRKDELPTIRAERTSIMKALYIDGRRNGYAPCQCGRTMTIGELIEFLQEFDEDRPVYLRNDNGYTYGSITESSFTPAEELEDEEDE